MDKLIYKTIEPMYQHGPHQTDKDPPTPIKCTLTDKQVKKAEQHAKQRDGAHSWSRNFNIDRVKTHLRGLKAELAFAQYYGLTPDLVFKQNGDNGVDFYVIKDGLILGLDIKATQYTDQPWLKVRYDNVKDEVNGYVLAAVNKETVQLVGVASQQKVISKEPTKRTGHYKNYILEPHELDPMPSQTDVIEAAKQQNIKL